MKWKLIACKIAYMYSGYLFLKGNKEKIYDFAFPRKEFFREAEFKVWEKFLKFQKFLKKLYIIV